MSNEKNIAIKNIGKTCCNCLKETQVKHIEIGALGYSSQFDNFSTQIDLCEDCLSKTNSEWWKLRIIDEDNDFGGHYEYEKEILEYVHKMPLAGQELFENHYAYGACADLNMEQQDWIDYQLDILPHDKCKEYCLYSPQEIQAYKDRFSNCKHVKINKYEDGSSGSRCFNNAFGDGGGKCDCNISDECYMCKDYAERDGEIKIVDVQAEYYKREVQRLQDMIAYATKRLQDIDDEVLKDGN